MAEKWRRCDSCRKVKAVAEYDGESPTCRACLQASTRARSAPVKTEVRVTTRPPVAGAAEMRRPMAVRGHGDREVRVRRARARAVERLVEAHREEFEGLLAEERDAEGLGDAPHRRRL